MNLKGLAFWKKKDDLSDLGLGGDLGGGDLGLGNPPGGDLGMGGGFGQQDMGGYGTTPGGGFSPIGAPASPQNFNFAIPKLEPVGSQGYNQFGQQPQQQPMFREAPPAPQYSPPQQSYDQSFMVSKEIEIISSKLDALHANLEAISQRLSTIERMMRLDQDKKSRYPW
jgi:hypothetical protein